MKHHALCFCHGHVQHSARATFTATAPCWPTGPDATEALSHCCPTILSDLNQPLCARIARFLLASAITMVLLLCAADHIYS
eukprot:365904-Chlamydomonas_euryale.AAC.6